ncbi:hypothetical protein [Vibrio sp. LaRot3]|uniref:hypothetical protein n=1 Tax=Vibrio sp. LaRot3 TaxID=2998829 RepID=UPI0022CE30AA|nr:hypothetical protein [Vibrio sp. LaRot3]MDA0149083.1 hypothetical protein [Vibrio sp. LaRot3]
MGATVNRQLDNVMDGVGISTQQTTIKHAASSGTASISFYSVATFSSLTQPLSFRSSVNT